MKQTNAKVALLFLGALTFLTNGDIYASAPLLLSIGTDLHIPVSSAALSVTSYMGAFALFNLFIGPVGDRFGRTRIVIFCSFGTSVFSCLCFFADSLSALIILRAFNGAFAAGIMPVSVAIIGELYDDNQRQKAIAAMVGIMLLGGASASFIGGGLSFVLSWKSVYLIYGLAELAISFMLLFILKRQSGTAKKHNAFRMYADVLKNRRVLSCLSLVGMSGIIVAGSFAFTGELIQGKTGLNLLEIGALLSCFGIGGIVSSRLSGMIERLPVITRYITAGCAGSIAIYGLVGTSLVPVLAIGLFLWGLAFVTIHSGYLTVAQNLIPELRGTIMSLMSFCMLAGGTIGSLVNKTIIEMAHIDYIYIYTAILFFVLSAFAAVVLYEISRLSHDKAVVCTQGA